MVMTDFMHKGRMLDRQIQINSHCGRSIGQSCKGPVFHL